MRRNIIYIATLLFAAVFFSVWCEARSGLAQTASQTVSSSQAGQTVSGASAQAAALGNKKEEFYVRGFSQYVAAFFLPCFPMLGLAAAVWIGFWGWKHVIQPASGFAPLALFWLAVTGMVCFFIFMVPFAMIDAAWQLYNLYHKPGLYFLNGIGVVALGFALWHAIGHVEERLKGPGAKRAGPTGPKVIFPKIYTLCVDTRQAQAQLERVSGQSGFPWVAALSPGKVAAATAKNAEVFFSNAEVLFSTRADGKYLFEVMKSGAVKLKNFAWNFIPAEDVVTLTFELSTGFLKSMKVNYQGGFDVLPEPFDRFIAKIAKGTETETNFLRRADNLRWFDPDVERGLFSSFFSQRFAPVTLYSILCRFLPITCQWEQDKTPVFIDCLPLLLVYEIGMRVVAGNKFLHDGIMDTENFCEQSGKIQSFSALGYFALKLWGHDIYLDHLKSLSLAAGEWEKAAGSKLFEEHIRRITPLWRTFARAAMANASVHAVKISEEVYLKEQIAAVKNNS